MFDAAAFRYYPISPGTVMFKVFKFSLVSATFSFLLSFTVVYLSNVQLLSSTGAARSKIYRLNFQRSRSIQIIDSQSVATADDEAASTEKHEQGLACKFPLLDPWDKSIMPYVEHIYGFQCGKAQPYLSLVVDGSFLAINESEYGSIVSTLSERQNLQCFLAAVLRRDKDDFNISLGEFTPLAPGERGTVSSDTARVICSIMPENKTIYNNTHALFSKAQLNKTKQVGQESEDRLSVLFFFIDSTSLSMFQRQLPKTYKYITGKMKFNIFKGYNKVGYNSFPNMVPIITGKRVYDQQPDMRDEFNGEDVHNQNFDHWPFIWKEFNKRGYVTAHNEDAPFWGLFQVYNQTGFWYKPVDHYFRSYWLSLHYTVEQSAQYCYGNYPKPLLWLNIIRDMYKVYKGQLKFMYSYLVEISHNVAAQLERADDILHQFFEEMHEGGHFNNTAIMLGSDHGLAFGDMRKTLVGAIEERMPINALWFPDWFYQKYPNVKQNLLKNRLRLTSNFDLPVTLRDVAQSNFKGQQRLQSERGLSQLYEIPLNRTCTDAGIPRQFCTCSPAKSVNVGRDKRVRLAAEFLVAEINKSLNKSIEAGLCAKLRLWSVFRAELSETFMKVFSHNDEKDGHIVEREVNVPVFSVALDVEPSKAQFEGHVIVDMVQNSLVLNGGADQISRLNAYGSQSHCIHDIILRRFCYCNKQIL